MNKDFKPYIPAGKVISEMTLTSIILGLLLAVIFGAANAYLGLRVGMTVSASIPAAVISMTIIRIIMKRDSILENNMVQTIGSAGESLAAGAIFTMPALFLWAREGVMGFPTLLSITVIAFLGGLLGVFFMVPLRNALIVKEHGILPYPEGTACAEVLLSGEKGGSSAKAIFSGMGIAAVVKFITDGFKVVPGTFTLKIESFKTELSAQIYPALISVGYICGPKIAAEIFAGGIIGWLVLIPSFAFFGDDTVAEIYAAGGASGIWSSHIRYIGAGAVATAGIISLIRTLPLIGKTFVEAMKGIGSAGASSSERTALDIDMRIVIGALFVIILGIWFIPAIPVTLIGAILIVIFGFFFSAVSSRMVGLIGVSNNPISGMTIATLLVATLLLKLAGDVGLHGMQSAIAIGTIICIAAAMAADTSQDLKTGYILGATPRKQQIGEILGITAAALVIGWVMILLDKAYGFGSENLSAPQATMMKLVIEGVMEENLPWALIFIGASISVAIRLLGASALATAMGIYLPFEVSAAIIVGGLIRLAVDKKNKNADNESSQGILFCSGLIAGEGLIGIILAVFSILDITDKIDLSAYFSAGWIGSIALFIALIIAIYRTAAKN